MTALKSAALYIRVSTEDQAEFSPEAQKRALLRYADEHGFTVNAPNIFIDEGVSGRRAEKRPAFMEMIAAAKSKNRPFQSILVHKFDRFARSREDSVVYKSLLTKECGVNVISITERVDDDKVSIILEAILEAMAEYYSINLSEEVKKGMTEKALRGGLQTTPSFGYAVSETANMLVPVAQEAALVQEIFHRFISGEGYFSISRWLNRLGVKTHRGNPFAHRTVAYMICNPVYIGKLRWNPSGKTGLNYDDKHLILADAEHAPLIDSKTWGAAQKRVAELKSKGSYHARPSSAPRDWLSGLIRCASCHSSLVFVQPHYWKCNGYVKGTCLTSQHIRDDLIKEALLRQLSADSSNEKAISYKSTRPARVYIDASNALQLQLSRLEKRLVRLRAAYLDGVETIQSYQTEKQALEGQSLALRNQIDLMSRRASDEGAFAQSPLQSVLEIIASPEWSNAQKHASVTSVVSSCFFDKKENFLEIYYRSPTSSAPIF